LQLTSPATARKLVTALAIGATLTGTHRAQETAPTPPAPETLVASSLPAVVAIRAHVPEGTRAGSGFLVNPSGVIISNLHVVEGANQVAVKLHSGEVFDQVKVAGFDRQRDLVVLRIPGYQLPSLQLGDSDAVAAGTQVFAIGHPSGLEGTVTQGIVSNVRLLDSGIKAIQTDAAASAGSSGGPLLNVRGEVIGVVTFKNVNGENLNFAVPVNYVRGLLGLEDLLSLEQLNARLAAGGKDLFDPGDDASINGLWKSLATGMTVRLKEDGEYIYGETLNADGTSAGGVVELVRKDDGTYEGFLRGVWSCWYFGGFPVRRMDKTCQIEQQAKVTALETNRIEGQLLYSDAPPTNTRQFVKYCKTCTASEPKKWHEVVLVRMD